MNDKHLISIINILYKSNQYKLMCHHHTSSDRSNDYLGWSYNFFGEKKRYIYWSIIISFPVNIWKIQVNSSLKYNFKFYFRLWWNATKNITYNSVCIYFTSFVIPFKEEDRMGSLDPKYKLTKLTLQTGCLYYHLTSWKKSPLIQKPSVQKSYT